MAIQSIYPFTGETWKKMRKWWLNLIKIWRKSLMNCVKNLIQARVERYDTLWETSLSERVNDSLSRDDVKLALVGARTASSAWWQTAPYRMYKMKNETKHALHESITDTGVGLAIIMPLNFIMLWIMNHVEMTVTQGTIFMSAVFTLFAIARKTYTRLHFSKRYK